MLAERKSVHLALDALRFLDVGMLTALHGTILTYLCKPSLRPGAAVQSYNQNSAAVKMAAADAMVDPRFMLLHSWFTWK